MFLIKMTAAFLESCDEENRRRKNRISDRAVKRKSDSDYSFPEKIIKNCISAEGINYGK